MKALIEEICSALASGDGGRLAVATVCSRKGSAPRTAGAKMLVRSDGSIAGTIGGGLLEGEAITAARELAAAGGGRRGRLCAFDLSGELGEGADLICGGKLEVLVEVLSAADRPLFEALSGALAAGRKGLLLTGFAGLDGDQVEVRARHLIIGADEVIGDACPLEPAVLRPLRRSRFASLIEQGELRVLAEPLYVAGTIYLFGAGHCSVPVAQIGSLLGFRVEVFDDRADFANAERFPGADRVAVLPGFERAFAGIVPDADSYVVIVTRGHSYDRAVLEQALGTDAGYIGMIGSRRKRDALYQKLREGGVNDDQLARVHCPIGLPIEAETPEEIAVSILAELVKDRAARKV